VKKPGFFAGKTNLLQGKSKETRFLRVSGGVKKPGFFAGKDQFVAGKTKRNPVSEISTPAL
jgi:hypothetical protein